MNQKPPRLRVPPHLQPWFDARQRFKLSHAVVQMARELGLNPKEFGKLADTRGSPWKIPLAEFIAECYFKAYKRELPERILPLEQVVADTAAKKSQRQERRAAARAQQAAAIDARTDFKRTSTSQHSDA